jgi:hypothetical protein
MERKIKITIEVNEMDPKDSYKESMEQRTGP